jgi:hypothetical protein
MIKRALPILALAALFASTNLTVNAQSKGDQAGSPRHGCPGEPDKSGRPGAAFVSLPKDIMAAEAQGTFANSCQCQSSVASGERSGKSTTSPWRGGHVLARKRCDIRAGTSNFDLSSVTSVTSVRCSKYF